jgi:hypothetical protein
MEKFETYHSGFMWEDNLGYLFREGWDGLIGGTLGLNFGSDGFLKKVILGVANDDFPHWELN